MRFMLLCTSTQPSMHFKTSESSVYYSNVSKATKQCYMQWYQTDKFSQNSLYLLFAADVKVKSTTIQSHFRLNPSHQSVTSPVAFLTPTWYCVHESSENPKNTFWLLGLSYCCMGLHHVIMVIVWDHRVR